MATVLAEAEVLSAPQADVKETWERDLSIAIAALATAVFPRKSRDGMAGKAVAITAATPGEGASTISALLAQHLARDPSTRVFITSAAALGRLCASSPQHLSGIIHRSNGTNAWTLNAGSLTTQNAPGPWSTHKVFREQLMETLRQEFDCVIADCSAIGTSDDLVNLAPLVDGVLLVVSAGRSTQNQILHAKQTIELLGGVLEGCCFNRQNSSPLRTLQKAIGR